MAEKLRYAITNCSEMDADFRVTDAEVPAWNLPLAATGARSQFADDS